MKQPFKNIRNKIKAKAKDITLRLLTFILFTLTFITTQAQRTIPSGGTAGQVLSVVSGIKLGWTTPTALTAGRYISLASNTVRLDTATFYRLTYNGTASRPGMWMSGTPFAGTATTSTPLFLMQEAATTAGTTWNTNGTYWGLNARSGFTGDYFNILNNNALRLKMSVNTLTIGGLYGTEAKLVLKDNAAGNGMQIYSGGGLNYITGDGQGSGSNMFISVSSNSFIRLSTNSVTGINLDGSQNVTLGSNTSISRFAIPITPTASSASGLFSMSTTTTGFDGVTTGYFSGSSTGTFIAINKLGTGNANFADWQHKGVSKFKVDSVGKTTATEFITAGNAWVKDSVYGASWNGSQIVPTRNAVYDKIEAIIASATDTTKIASLHGNAMGNGTFLGATNNRGLRFRTNNKQWVYLDSIGRFGINVVPTTSAAKLQVNGAIQMIGADNFAFNGGSVSGAVNYTFSTGTQIYSESNGVINLTTGGSSTIFDRIILGNTSGSTSEPAIVRRGTKVVFMLGNASANTNISVKDTVYSSDWNGSSDVPTKNAVYDKIETFGVTSAGTYTPTIASVANVSASTARQCTYSRVGNTVTVGGQCDIDPGSADILTTFSLTLPVSSNFTTVYQGGGTACGAPNGGRGDPGTIQANSTSDKIEISFFPYAATNRTVYFTFTYEVL